MSEDLKRQVCEAIDNNKEKIISLAERIQDEPEIGFKEEKTSFKVSEELENMGLSVEENLAITGVKSEIGNNDKLKIGILGELDGLINPDHPKSDPKTGAVHACGHHAQIANLIGTAYGFTQTNIIDDLLGTIKFFAVPAEEYIDLEYRKRLIDEGKLSYFSGKQELIARGHFDDLDAAMMVHADNNPNREVLSHISMNGFLGKFVKYIGKSAHAGAEPEKGINALNAANIGLQAINSRRETFKDEDVIRVHPVITKGGDSVNVVPSDVRIETYVRAKDSESIIETNKKIDQALKGGALSIGTNIEINDYPGYMPFKSDELLGNIFEENVKFNIGKKGIINESPHVTASTDMGDISQIMPSIEPSIGGFKGNIHSKDFKIVDKEMAYIIPAKITACTLIDILKNKKTIKKIKKRKNNKKSTKEYLKTLNKMKNKKKAEYMK